MAEDLKQKLDIPWATLLPIVAAFAGIVAQYRPLVSTRPPVPNTKAAEVIADQDVDARLWEDPLVVVQKQKAILEADPKFKDVPSGIVQPHSTAALAHRIAEAAKEAKGGQVLLLAVMLDSGPYLEQAESRLRGRQAVMEGLSESGFVPVDGEHIGFVVERPWPPPIITPPNDSAASGALVLAWEECRDAHDVELKSAMVPVIHSPEPRPLPRAGNFQRVFVLWLPGASFNPLPLGNFATLVTKLVGENHPQVEVRMIGPATSTGLQHMLREAVEWPQSGEKKFDAVLDGLRIYSARATASDEALYGEPMPEDKSLEDVIDAAVAPGAREGLQFRRTIIPDDEVLSALIEELPLRRVHITPWEKSTNKWVNGDHVIILTEWDNPYGRSLARTFEKEAQEAQAAKRPKAPEKVSSRIDFYRYMHGIDGRLPGDSAKDKMDDSQKNQNTSSNTATEATEGINRADFLRRLAVHLKSEEAGWLRHGDTGVGAIGLLGSDIYDKLMILRALRPEFSNAIFFTNNYDAHFERREDWDDVHNLVVASPFGSMLSSERQKSLAPFRDSDQTSMFAGTLLATGKITNFDEVLRQPHIFEIGRKGVCELLKTGGESVSSLPPNTIDALWFREWLSRPAVALGLAIGMLGLGLMVGWIGLSMVDRKLPGGGNTRDRFKRLCSSTPFWLTLSVPIIILSVGYFSQSGSVQSGGAVEEPLAFLSGISIWPSEMLRLIALLLAIHFMIKAHIELKANELELTRRFNLGSLLPEEWDWRKLHLGLRRWQKEYPELMRPDARFTAKQAWIAYLRRNQFRPRLIRIAALLAIYAVFSLGVLMLFPFPVTPARGETAFCADLCVLIPAVVGMMMLTFYVVDAIRLNSNFIRVVTGGVTEWRPDISVGKGRIPPLTEEDLSPYYDISFVAQRTKVVAPLIWYPLIVLAMMFVARSSYFDNWTWPTSLILVFALNATWAFGSAAFLRRAAEQLRETAIENLKVLRAESYKVEEKQKVFDELITEIHGLKKGAFAPLSEQPFIRAVILPSGGLGLLALGQRLLDFF
jgi:hypothetical protein